MEDKLLTSLGLNSKEIKLYKAVMKAREVSPAQLARAVGIKRTTCYSLARGLAEKGFLIENSTKRPRTFSLASPADIEDVLSGERKRLVLREKVLKQFASELSRATAGESYPVPSIRFVEEEKLKQFLTKQAPVWDGSALRTDSMWWGFQDHTYVDNFSHVIDAYWRRAPKTIVLKLLSNKSLTEYALKGRHPRRQIKFWDKADNFISTTWIIGDYVVIINTRKHPFYLVEMHDATLAHDMREVFKNLWPLV